MKLLVHKPVFARCPEAESCEEAKTGLLNAITRCKLLEYSLFQIYSTQLIPAATHLLRDTNLY